MDRVRERSAYVLAVLAVWFGGLILPGNRLIAQGSTASIAGTVRDASGAVLPGAAVTVKHLETGLTRNGVTDANGSFNVPSLPVGAYQLNAAQHFHLESRVFRSYLMWVRKRR